MRFLADMGVSHGVVEWLRSARPRRVASARRRAAPPPQRRIFQKEVIEHRVVLTFDLDFGEIVAASEGGVVSGCSGCTTRAPAMSSHAFKPC